MLLGYLHADASRDWVARTTGNARFPAKTER
jgi:hypothetical protein